MGNVALLVQPLLTLAMLCSTCTVEVKSCILPALNSSERAGVLLVHCSKWEVPKGESLACKGIHSIIIIIIALLAMVIFPQIDGSPEEALVPVSTLVCLDTGYCRHF